MWLKLWHLWPPRIRLGKRAADSPFTQNGEFSTSNAFFKTFSISVIGPQCDFTTCPRVVLGEAIFFFREDRLTDCRLQVSYKLLKIEYFARVFKIECMRGFKNAPERRNECLSGINVSKIIICIWWMGDPTESRIIRMGIHCRVSRTYVNTVHTKERKFRLK